MTGKTLNHYRITRKLASCGMGEVHVARDTTQDRDIALKKGTSPGNPPE